MTSSLDLIRGRQVVQTLTNKSGGGVIAGDVVIIDTANDESFTTTTSAAYNATQACIALDTIASNATGRVLLQGYAPLVNVSASATRGYYLFTHTVAKQATSSASFATGAFGQVLKAGTTPSAYIFPPSTSSSGSDPSKIPAAGWVSDSNTWSYSSADAPTFVISVNADMTNTIAIGQRIKLTQTTVKYFIVTAVGNFGGGATLITVYGGTDYTLANAAITSPNYSVVKAPFGFPLNPTKWTVSVTDSANRSQASPTKNTWYNLGTTNSQISIPIGLWMVSYKVGKYGYRSGTVWNYVQVTLSTANNTESDTAFTMGNYSGGGNAPFDLSQTCFVSGLISVASKTTYYLNALWDRDATLDGTSIMFLNAQVPMVINAVCAYL